MIVRVKLLHSNAMLPVQRNGDAGADVYAPYAAVIAPGRTFRMSLGIAIELPAGHAALLLPRSGLSSKSWTVFSPPIDENYRGEISAILHNANQYDTWRISAVDRIAQLVVIPVPRVSYEEFSELSVTDRGEDGFGSSGLNGPHLPRREPGNGG